MTDKPLQATSTRSCTCHKEELLKDSSGLKKGDHITRDLNKRRCKRCSIPSHHAIFLKVIKQESPSQAGEVTLKLAHYAPEEKNGETIYVAKISEENFKFQQQDVYRVNYNHPKFIGDAVAQNAKKEIAENPQYKTLRYNCEHFCVSCVTGQKSSSQVENLGESLSTCLHCCIRFIYSIFAIISFVTNVLDDITAGTQAYKGAIPGWVLILQCIGLVCYLCIIFAPFIRSVLKFYERERCKTCLCISFLKLLSRLVYVFLTVCQIIVSFFHNNKIMEGQNISDKEANSFKNSSISLTVISLLYLAGIEIFFKCSLKCRRKWFKCCSKLCARDCYSGCGRECIEECDCFEDKCINKIISSCVNLCVASRCDWIPLLIQIMFAIGASIPDFVYIMIHNSESMNGNVFDWLIIIKCVLLALYLQPIVCPLICALTLKDRAFLRSIVKFLVRFMAVVINVVGTCALIKHNNTIKKNKSIQDDEYKTFQNDMKICFGCFISYVLVVEIVIRIFNACHSSMKCRQRSTYVNF